MSIVTKNLANMKRLPYVVQVSNILFKISTSETHKLAQWLVSLLRHLEPRVLNSVVADFNFTF